MILLPVCEPPQLNLACKQVGSSLEPL